MPTHPEPRTAAALVIGNELLTGKVEDVNVSALAQALFPIGIRLRRVIFCPDEVETIRQDLDHLRRHHDLVFTSGGVGPTHDDVTVEAVAAAFGRPLVTSEEIRRLLEEVFGDRLTKSYLRMAQVPEGTRLVTSPRHRWPTVRVENVFILPGLPEIFRRKLPLIQEHLDIGHRFVSKAVGTRRDEGELAPLLGRLATEHPEVSIGSYPRWGDGPVRVRVTFDATEEESVDRALLAFRSAIGEEDLIPEGESEP
jgi:molybdenum cofactor synthesis domain-containing protein